VFALEPVIVKVGFGDGTSVMSGLAVKTVVAAAGMWAYLRWRNALPAPGDLVRSPNRRWYLLAGLSNSVFLLSYYAALSLAPVSLVVPILQLSPLIVMALSYAFLDKLERVTLGLVAGAVVVVLGQSSSRSPDEGRENAFHGERSSQVGPTASRSPLDRATDGGWVQRSADCKSVSSSCRPCG